VVWRKEIATRNDPRILGDLLYSQDADAVVLNSWGGKFYALDAASGDEKFTWDAGVTPYAGATAGSQGPVYSLRVLTERGTELVEVTSTGQEVVLHHRPEAQRGARRTLGSSPGIERSAWIFVFVMNCDQGSLLQAWSIKSQRLMWSRDLPASVQATPALRSDGVLMIADLAGIVHGITADGVEKFATAPAPSSFWPEPLARAVAHRLFLIRLEFCTPSTSTDAENRSTKHREHFRDGRL
jgi:outer membrane protein assembly factor BamB